MASAGLASLPTRAATVDLGDGLEFTWALDAAWTQGWRAKEQNLKLVGPVGGGSASADSGTFNLLNYDKGDKFSNLLRLVGEAGIRKDGMGLFLRAKAWDNLALSQDEVRYGAPSNNFTANARLRDDDFDTRLSKFKGVALLDLYGYTKFKFSDSVQGDIKLGQLAVNWGESLFVPGVSAYSVVDVNALRQPGTLIKEAILPVPQIALSLQLPGQLQLEAFYQVKWERTSIDGCGTYWSPEGALNCSKAGFQVAQRIVPIPAGPLAGNYLTWPTLGAQWLGGNAQVLSPTFQPIGLSVPANTAVPRLADKEPSNSGQFGVSAKKFIEPLDTEFGLYFVNYHTHGPAGLSFTRDSGSIPGSVFAGTGSSFWDYSASNIKIFGLSASTQLAGWSVAGELSYTKGIPAAINGVDLFLMSVRNVGPANALFQPRGSGATITGWERKNKTQINASALKVFGNVLGAAALSVVGEMAVQQWSGIGDPFTSIRYGRSFLYGPGAAASLGGAAACGFAGSPVNAIAANCSNDGYATRNAWGLRLSMEAEYPNLIPDVVVKPRLFLSKDVKGWSADGVFSQGRHVASLGTRFIYQRKYFVDLNYSAFNRGAHFDAFNDRDFYSLVFGASF